MSRSKNTIKKSDASSTPIKVKYSNTYASQSLYSNGITTNRGIYYTANKAGKPGSTTYTARNNYAVIRQLYYQNYLTGSVSNQSASYWDSSLQSTAASGTLDDDYRYFPSATGSNISFLAIPRTQFGEQISRKTFKLLSTDGLTYSIIDDGNGNIVDTFNNNVHVGNIIYSQAIVTITNPDYVGIILNFNFTFNISVATGPSPTPTPTVSTTPNASKTPTPTITPSLTRTPTVTPSITITKTASPSPGASKTPTPTKTPSKTITPTVTSTPTVTPTMTVTPSPSPDIQATIYVYGFNNGSGFVLAEADNNGDIKDDITITGTISRYSGTNCTTLLGGCSFIGSTQLFIPNGTPNGTFTDTLPLCANGGANSWKPTALVVNGTTITSSPQIVTIGSNDYKIIGYNVCGAL
jgi:hypothetical protein